MRIVAKRRYPYSGRPVIVEVGELVAEPLDVVRPSLRCGGHRV